MIKINLLSEGKRPTAVRRDTSRKGGMMGGENAALLVLVLTVVFACLLGAGVWLKLKSDLGGVQDEVRVAQAEVERLREVLKEVEAFEQKKAELEHKIAVINELKRNQRGPVLIMDAVSRALPELLWLDELSMGPANVTINGRAFNMNAVANFVESLDQVPEFQEPNLRDSAQRGQVYNFVVAFNYTYSPVPAEGEGDEGGTVAAAGG